MPSGGNHPPREPAQVSGPGALSRRTDGQPIRVAAGGAYGDRQELQQLQSAAPLAAAGGVTAQPAGIDPSQLTGLGEPTASPDMPVTAGAAAGAGPGPEALGLPNQTPEHSEAQALGRYLPVMIRVADRDDATPEFRRYVRELIANL